MSAATSDNGKSDILSADFSRFLAASDEQDVVVAHCGMFEPDDVNSIAFLLERKLKEAGEKKGVIKRIFSIIIEALQNIRLHGERFPDSRQDAYIVISRIDSGFRIRTVNLVRTDAVKTLQGKLDHLASLNEEELKEYYVQVLTNGQISDKGGAGLGFITIALKSRNPLDWAFVPIDDEPELSLFQMESLVEHR